MITDTEDICIRLAESARLDPTRLAAIAGPAKLTVGELDQLSQHCAVALAAHGIGPGVRTVLMVTPGIEFMVLAFGLLKAGAVLVVVDPGMGWQNLKTCLDEAAPKAFIGVPKAHLGRMLFRWGSSTIRVRVSVGGGFRLPGWIPYQRLIKPDREEGNKTISRDLDEMAAIVFTSGSTGTPKGVVYTRRMFATQARLLRTHFGIAPREVDLATFPLFALYDPLMAVTAVFPEMDFTKPGAADPEKIADTVRTNHVTHIFGSPALLENLGRYGESVGLKLPEVKRVLSAGAPVPGRVLLRVGNMLSAGAQIHTPYGATEALPVCSIAGPELQALDSPGKGVCVGRPLEGVQLAVIRITDEPIALWSDNLQVPDGQIGELVVWGENVSTSYWRRPVANSLAKIQTTRGDVRHRMGDVGFLDEKGRVWFCGRKSQRVIAQRGTLFTIPCESVFNQHPKVRRTALVGVGCPPMQRPVLCVELSEKTMPWDTEGLREELLAIGSRHPITNSITEILFHPAFPVDVRHNAKIFREKLAAWAEVRLR